MKRIFVTGASGFLAKHIIARLLSDGYAVRTSVRDMAKAPAIAMTVSPARQATTDLEFAQCDLRSTDDWREAMEGSDAVIHTASPFPQVQPRDERELIEPAVSGTLAVLSAAAEAGIRRVVMTSSLAAIIYAKAPDGQALLDESSWTDLEFPGLTPYAISKTLAEKAAWSFVRQEALQMERFAFLRRVRIPAVALFRFGLGTTARSETYRTSCSAS